MYPLLRDAGSLSGVLHEVGHILGAGMRQHCRDIGHCPLITCEITGNSHHDHDHKRYSQLPQCSPNLDVVPASNRFGVPLEPAPESLPNPFQIQRIEFASQQVFTLKMGNAYTHKQECHDNHRRNGQP